jgi:4-amino-4-deoxy-L-arabinose transferase-like glycosyltransferase
LLTLAAILFGCLFTLGAAFSIGRLVLGPLPAPRTIALAAGSALLSLIVFGLAAFGIAGRAAFLTIGAAAVLAALVFCRGRGRGRPGQDGEPLRRSERAILAFVFVAYGAFYFVHALAPEIQPDAGTYHLGLTAEILRLGGFPHRIGFYEMLPQGLEMLFAFGFAFGGPSSAKLIHFGFLVATVPLIVSVGRRLKLPPASTAAAAGFYALSPVVGISGASAYNDAALVFFVMAAFSLLWSWHEERRRGYLLAAGLAAGFCFSVKTTGLLVAVLVVVFVAASRRWKEAVLAGLTAALMIAPWMVRNAAAAGNPLAPLFNSVFPNPHFYAASERALAESLRSYGGVSAAAVPLELTLRGRVLHGMLGPLFLLAPLGLLLLRRREGRILWTAFLLLAAPWLLNMGTRFLMPALPFLCLALAASLPRPAAWTLLLLHAVACWPAVIALYEAPGAWRLRGFPVRAALRLEPENEYLDRTYPEYRLARLLEENVPPGSRVLDLQGAATAYTRAEVLVFWQSAAADRLRQALSLGYHGTGLLYEAEVRWPAEPLFALRFRQPADREHAWDFHEVLLYNAGVRERGSPEWVLSAWPNVWESPLAFDGNPVSRWDARERVRTGMYLEVEFDRALTLDRAVWVCSVPRGLPEVHGRTLDGSWKVLSARPELRRHEAQHLRLRAIGLFRREGVRYILAPVGTGGNGLIGRSLAEDPNTWGVQNVACRDGFCLQRIP